MAKSSKPTKTDALIANIDRDKSISDTISKRSSVYAGENAVKGAQGDKDSVKSALEEQSYKMKQMYDETQGRKAKEIKSGASFK
jgi:hypothetical protein